MKETNRENGGKPRAIDGVDSVSHSSLPQPPKEFDVPNSQLAASTDIPPPFDESGRTDDTDRTAKCIRSIASCEVPSISLLTGCQLSPTRSHHSTRPLLSRPDKPLFHQNAQKPVDRDRPGFEIRVRPGVGHISRIPS
jgi:hypothetical protein